VDPYGGEHWRWWDGERWTDLTHPFEAASAPSTGTVAYLFCGRLLAHADEGVEDSVPAPCADARVDVAALARLMYRVVAQRLIEDNAISARLRTAADGSPHAGKVQVSAVGGGGTRSGLEGELLASIDHLGEVPLGRAVMETRGGHSFNAYFVAVWEALDRGLVRATGTRDAESLSFAESIAAPVGRTADAEPNEFHVFESECEKIAQLEAALMELQQRTERFEQADAALAAAIADDCEQFTLQPIRF
jgi:hypothetical protein